MKTALIFGVTGQDGSYLVEHLLERGYRVVGVKRRSSSINTARLRRVTSTYHEDIFTLVHGDITDTSSVYNLVSHTLPDEIYNLAAQSHVGVSFDEPEYTSQVDAIGTLRLMEAVRTQAPKAKVYQASTSELFGGLAGQPLNETSGFNPRSPYAAAKLYAFHIIKQYREGYGLRAFNGILFNHESPRRSENFVSRKITLGLSELISRKAKTIYLGNLEAVRDWGHAADYVEAMVIMLNKATPDDYVVATGQCHSVRDFCVKAFKLVGMVVRFRGEGLDEVGYIHSYCDPKFPVNRLELGAEVIKVSQTYFRPLDVPHLLGDATKFKSITGWRAKVTFDELVYEMVKSDLHV